MIDERLCKVYDVNVVAKLQLREKGGGFYKMVRFIEN